MSDSMDRISEIPADGRLPVETLYQSYARLTHDTPGLQQSTLYSQRLALPGQIERELPIVSLRTSQQGPALWVLAGIHGEEPAGPNAIARNLDVFRDLARQGVPWVLWPLCNPKGYALDWRYPDLRRQGDVPRSLAPGGRGPGQSVGDCTHLLPDAQAPSRPRNPLGPACPEAEALSRHALALARDYPLLLSLDLHEDEDESSGAGAAYVYAQGTLGSEDPVAQEIVGLLRAHGFLIPQEGHTRFGEPIHAGVVPPTLDGSLDELLAAHTILQDGQVRPGPAARSMIVVETPTTNILLERRIVAHAAILHALAHFWTLAKG
jgi:hypothetical protein